MFMRTTEFAPQVTYNRELGAWGSIASAIKKTGVGFKPKPRLSKHEAALQFNDWLQRRFPRVSDRVRGFNAHSSMRGMDADFAPGDVPDYMMPVAAKSADKPWYQNFLDQAAKYAPQIVASKVQYDLVKLNVARAKQGLPPIDSSSVSPTVRVQTGVDADTRKLLVYGGVGVGAIALLALATRK